jgi:uncharacterized protein YdeI (YjbR/CyaY-like superfamily)
VGEPEPIYFESPAALCDWFDAYHQTAAELWVGYWKKGTGHPTVTWPEAVLEALCVGWIDGVRYSVDAERSRQRFTPRRKGSNWSVVNVRNVERLIAEARTAIYSYEQRHEARLTDAEEARFRASPRAWGWFVDRPKSYRTAATWWVASPKREETRERRLASLIEASAAGRTVKALTPPVRRPDGPPGPADGSGPPPPPPDVAR